jgi:hypothetical protein
LRVIIAPFTLAIFFILLSQFTVIICWE